MIQKLNANGKFFKKKFILAKERETALKLMNNDAIPPKKKKNS